MSSHSIKRVCVSGFTVTGSRPFFMALLRKISAKDVLMTARIPQPVNAQGACSRDEPQPKLSPATRICAPWYSGLLRGKSGLGPPSGR